MMESIFQKVADLFKRAPKRNPESSQSAAANYLGANPSDKYYWGVLANSHPLVFDAFQLICDLAPNLTPYVWPSSSAFGFSLEQPRNDRADNSHLDNANDLHVALNLEGGFCCDTPEWSGVDCKNDEDVARKLIDMARKAGYVDVVEREGLSGPRLVLVPGKASSRRPEFDPTGKRVQFVLKR